MQIPRIEKLGGSKNVFYNFYWHLKNDNKISNSYGGYLDYMKFKLYQFEETLSQEIQLQLQHIGIEVINLDKNYVRTFHFTDNKIEKVTFKTTTRGDITQDEATLNELNKQCTDIRDGLESLNGASIECDYQNGKLVETEKFDLATYDYEQTSAAYTEAGADMLKFDNGEDVDRVKTSMLQAGFSCEKMD